jgi:oxygen-independent coproporphyrinogen-3 oxidase
MEALAAAKTAIDQSETVGEDALVFEFMLNALRLPEGFASSAFRDHTGLDLTLAASALARATEQGLLERSPQWIRPTPLGLRFLNDLQTLFLPSPQRRGRRAIPIQPVA